uniref:Uncharacterized protein n=1 Tax=Mycena chlorophos TaxID=658473 RepID=A0ABQ0LK89_MYCCL|nr:predicted protein [Mycena chlorophos]
MYAANPSHEATQPHSNGRGFGSKSAGMARGLWRGKGLPTVSSTWTPRKAPRYRSGRSPQSAPPAGDEQAVSNWQRAGPPSSEAATATPSPRFASPVLWLLALSSASRPGLKRLAVVGCLRVGDTNPRIPHPGVGGTATSPQLGQPLALRRVLEHWTVARRTHGEDARSCGCMDDVDDGLDKAAVAALPTIYIDSSDAGACAYRPAGDAMRRLAGFQCRVSLSNRALSSRYYTILRTTLPRPQRPSSVPTHIHSSRLLPVSQGHVTRAVPGLRFCGEHESVLSALGGCYSSIRWAIHSV